MEKLLVVLLHGIGDSLMAVPALHALKQKHAGSTLSVMTIGHPLFRDLWSSNKDVDEVLLSSVMHNPHYGNPLFWASDYWAIRRDAANAVRVHGFTKVFFVKMFTMPAKLYGYLPFERYRRHKTEVIARELGVELSDQQYWLHYGEQYGKWADLFLKYHQLDTDILVGLHFIGSTPNKSLPAEAREELMELLLSMGYHLLLFDSKQTYDGKSISEERGVVHYFSDHILKSAALVDRCAFLICVDSGVGHVAAALKKKLFSIYFKKVWMENSVAIGNEVYPYLYRGDVNDLLTCIRSFLHPSS